jgi:hypothetical protein
MIRIRCSAELATLCSGAPHGGGVLACLERLVAADEQRVGAGTKKKKKKKKKKKEKKK